jgi:Family of unknown function (DUF6279)
MITTFSAMRSSRIKTSIIGLLILLCAAALGGCSSIRLAYGNAPQLLWWWIDGYVDFNGEQSPPVRQGLDNLHEWHRNTQLPALMGLLATAQAQVAEPTTAGQACRWQTQVREALEPTLQRALQLTADTLPSLTEANYRHIEQRYAKGNTEMKRDFLQADAQDRLDESVKRTLERVERVYGRVGDAQKRVVREGVAASPFDPELWLAERQRRQREVLQTLRRLSADKADADQRLAALRVLVQRLERSPDPEYRAYQQRLGDYNCAFAAQIHNSTTPAQRQRARENFKGWEEDLRTFLPAS